MILIAYSLGNGSVFKPSNIYPNNQYIDASVDNTFSCTIQGSNITNIELDILDSTGAIIQTYLYNSEVYNTGDTFTFTVPAGTLDNQKTYSWYMVMSNTVDINYTLASVNSDTCQFYTLANPVLTITDPVNNSTIHSSKYTATGTWAQANFIPIAWYQYKLTDSYGNVFYGDKVETDQSLKFVYDNYQDGVTYTLQVIAEGTNGVQVSSTPITFETTYLDLLTTTVTLSTSILCDKDAVEMIWTGDVGTDILFWNIKRKEVGYDNIINLCRLDSSVMHFIDYSSCSGHSYIYYLFPENWSLTGKPVISNTVTPNWFNWSLTDPTGSGKVFIFNNNLTSDALTNATDRTEYETYTKYNKVNKGLRDFKKLKLSFLIGDFDTSIGSTTDYIEDLRSVVNNTNTKYLKTRSGELLIGDAFNLTYQYLDEIGSQPYTVTFEFEELQDNIFLGKINEQNNGNIYWQFL